MVMATLAWSPALRSEVKRTKLLEHESAHAVSNAQNASGYLSHQEKRAIEKVFSTKANTEAKSFDYWI